MIERAPNALVDSAKVLVPNGLVLAVVNAMTLKDWLNLMLISLSIGYTIWRWRRDSYVVCQACRDGRPPVNCPLPDRKRPAWCPRR
jgi:hypothetical protein